MSRDSKGPRKSFSKSGSSDFNKKKSFSNSDKPKRSFTKERREDSYEGRSKPKSFGDKEKRSYRKDGDFEKPRRSFDRDDKPKSFGDKEKRSYRKDGDFEKPRRSFDRDDKKSFIKKADGKYESTSRRDFDRSTRKRFDDGEGNDFAKKQYKDENGYSFKKPYKTSYKRKDEVKPKKKGPARTSNQENVSEDAVRLNRYIANAGICSRREADVLIATGVVSVNGKIITEMGFRVNPTDVVTYGGVPIKNETKKYLVLNKPKDYITTMDDPESRKTVMDLIRKACKERLYPVGRLDRNTTGILLFTNDGDLTAKLTHPKFEIRKVYHVTLDKKLTSEDYKMLNEGLDLADGFIKPDAAEFVGTGKTELGIEIHSGRNRIVRRMFEHLGYEVIKLDRVAFAGLTKKDLPKGKFRFLTDKEVAFLKMLG